jgi:uncharacterized protein YdbL (DUF1318 family)
MKGFASSLTSNFYLAMGVSLCLSSCVTVNVNFPEGAVQKAADDYVSELYRAKEKSEQEQKPPAPAKKGAQWISIFLPVAGADEISQGPSLKLSTPKAKEIQDRQAKRLKAIDEFKKKGVIGETEQGLIETRDASAVKGLARNLLDKIVADENADREELYKELAQANSLSATTLSAMRRSFYESFKKASPAGSWYKTGGEWKKK